VGRSSMAATGAMAGPGGTGESDYLLHIVFRYSKGGTGRSVRQDSGRKTNPPAYLERQCGGRWGAMTTAGFFGQCDGIHCVGFLVHDAYEAISGGIDNPFIGQDQRLQC
jgi:hypothetical protein